MNFDEIIPHILNGFNKYEKERGIKTVHVECSVRRENWAIFEAHKSDNTRTLFYARKGKRASEDKWRYFCPSENEACLGLPTLCELYRLINHENSNRRVIPKVEGI